MTTSKAETLIQIQNKLKNFTVPKLYVFKVKNWNNNKDLIIKDIQKNFINKKKIIIRSSSSNEDNLKTSAAGMFESVLNINPKNRNQIKNTIKKVIKSYKKYSVNILNEQILVQEMITNIKMSGVIFTGNFLNYNLYYTINYDDVTGLTNTITSGSSTYSNKTLYILKDKSNFIRSKRFKIIIKATKEIENFYVKWSDDRLVIDKWFSLQTSLSPPSKSLKIAKTLTRHCDFNEKNPNRFRATIGGFSQNLAAFHEQDGAGYKFVTDWIKEIDALNPQLAARTCTAFQNWKQFDDLRQEKISFELTKILKVCKLSKDTTEMITRMLDK